MTDVNPTPEPVVPPPEVPKAPPPPDPDPATHRLRLACGCSHDTASPCATEHECEDHGLESVVSARLLREGE